eukprot:TRINITY_DN38349_c0_g1_i1.p1 TRINITY_DN38349_c0_g1~~TRINITY_DN38349_c0_g1_i1.p1  ORF type:complete len:223 (-),score=39.47 TRINITY_DN38349_c0_g1_i1:224-892(-)
MEGLSFGNKIKLVWAGVRIGASKFTSLVSTSVFGAEQKADRYKAKLMVLGLEGAGKTHILQACKDDKREVIPTNGTNIQDLMLIQDRFELQMVLWEIGGGDVIRPHWFRYAEGVHGIVFVIDPAEPLEPAFDALRAFLEHGGPAVWSIPVLLLVNHKSEDNDRESSCIREQLRSMLGEVLRPGCKFEIIAPGTFQAKLFGWFATVLLPATCTESTAAEDSQE